MMMTQIAIMYIAHLFENASIGRSKAWVCNRWLAGIVGSNPVVCLL